MAAAGAVSSVAYSLLSTEQCVPLSVAPVSGVQELLGCFPTREVIAPLDRSNLLKLLHQLQVVEVFELPMRL